MLCDKCRQREATVHKQVIINGVAHSEHLCAECAAKERGGRDPFAAFFGSDLFGERFFGSSFADIFGPLFQLTDGQSGQQTDHESGIGPCPSCGMTWDDFQRNGFLGCSECYDHFKNALPPLMQELHRAQQEAPVSDETSDRKPMSAKEHLQAEMARAIDAEKFEEAARLRDAIKALEDAEKGGAPEA